MLFSFCFWLFASLLSRLPAVGRIEEDELMLISEPEGTGEQANGK